MSFAIHISVTLVGVASSMFVAAAASSHDGGTASATARETCQVLANKTIAGATVIEAAEIAARAEAPHYCKVSARMLPSLNFEMRIPERWNGKLHYRGGGGFNGYIPALAGYSLAALKMGYITVSSDSGHQAASTDASWASDDPHAFALYGYLSVPTVMSAAVEMIEAAYGRKPVRSYFEGCSNGGREGAMTAERFPNLFDGIIVGCPALGMPALVGTYHSTIKALAAPGANLTSSKLKSLSDAVLSACDDADGIADQIVSNPSACRLQLEKLRCPEGRDAHASCLSDANLAVVQAWTSPAAFANGAYRYPGFPLTGNESDPGSWDFWLLAPKALAALFQDTAIKHLIEQDVAVDAKTYDYYSNPTALARWSSVVDPTHRDLRPLHHSGAKLILWHGSNDMSVSYRMTNEYYEDVVAAAGGGDQAQNFVRYYILPGVNHCDGSRPAALGADGRGASTIDWLTPLDAWVETGQPPTALTATKLNEKGGVDFTRPVCAYPTYPRFVGRRNDRNAAQVAANFECAAP